MADLIRYLSLFAGIGGLDLAVHRGLERVGLGARCVGLVEGEAFAAVTLAAAMERGALAPCPVWLGDIREFPAADFAGAVDLVVAGFPCPPVSSVGKRRGVDDERWLWPEVVRVLRDSGARYLFVENVRGLLSANGGRAFGDVLGDLADLGFDAEWELLVASAVGAPHRRERVFVLAHDQRGRLGERAVEALVQRAEGRRGLAPTGGCGDVADREHAGQRGQREGDDRPLAADAPRHDADGCDTGVADAEDSERRRGEPGEPGERRRGHRGGDAALGDGDGDGDGSQGLTAPGAAAGATVGAGGGELADAEHGAGGGAARIEHDDRGAVAGSAGERRCPFCGLGELADPLHVREFLGEGEDGAPDVGTKSGRRDVRARGCGGWPRPFPPGPGDRAAWAAVLKRDPTLAPAVEPDLRGVADGLPARLVLGGRADQLRGLGNAVVPECGAVAFAELWGRLED